MEYIVLVPWGILKWNTCIPWHGESLKWEVKYTKDYKVRTLSLQVRAPEEIEVTFAMVLA
jgi:hypothetical protein